MAKVSMRVDYTLKNYSLSDQIRIAKEVGVNAVETGELKGYDCRLAGEIAAKYGLKFISCGFYDIWNARVGAPYAEIKRNLEKTIECAKDLGSKILMSLTIDGIDRGEKKKAEFVENMRPVADLCMENDMLLLLEPHSTKYKNPLVDMSKYFLNGSAIAYELMDRIGCPNIKLLFDVYHCQTMEGDIFKNIEQNVDKIAHFHLAGIPDRDEPMNGEIHYQNLIRFANACGYQGYYGLEYFPTNPEDLEMLKKAVDYIKNA